MELNKQFARANERAKSIRSSVPYAIGAGYDRGTGRIVVSFPSGIEVAFRPQMAEGLAGAAAEDLEKVEITPSGYGIHFPTLDVDLSLPNLLAGAFGTRKWMAAQLGQAGGKMRSRKKAAAARENGKRGGRPRRSGREM